jgi:hypothetical protein
MHYATVVHPFVLVLLPVHVMLVHNSGPSQLQSACAIVDSQGVDAHKNKISAATKGRRLRYNKYKKEIMIQGCAGQ